MNYRDIIKSYKPINEQEMKDKIVFLQCIDNFKDTLTRENVVCHFTASAFVVNKNRDKTLMIYHNIYNTWAWTGGHMDGEEDFLKVALKELREETGIKTVKLLSDEIMSLDVLPVAGHMKNGVYIAPHLHLNIAYLFECSEEEEVRAKLDENSGVKWLEISRLNRYVEKEPYISYIYKKIMDKGLR
ncbi:MAG: NUDIX hydrolase [Clostridium sp.]